MSDNSSFRVLGQKVPSNSFLSTVSIDGVAFHFGQSAEDIILLRLFNKLRNGFYVDIGAFHPRQYSNTYLLHNFFNWRGINIDASSETIELFKTERPNDINIHLGVSDIESEEVYYKFNYPARNTISEENVRRQFLKGDVKIVGEEKVNTLPLEIVLDEYLPREQKIDLLNIDVEGVDLKVLKSNNWSKYRPNVILIEDYSFQSTGLEDSLIYSFLKENGYKFFSHSFDTSVYVEANYFNGDNIFEKNNKNELKKFLKGNGLEHNPIVYQRSSILVKKHPEYLNVLKELETLNKEFEHRKLTDKLSIAISDLENKKAINRLLNEKLEMRRAELEIIQERYSIILAEQRRAKKNYDDITNSRSWRYTLFIRKLIGYVKNKL